MTFIQTGKVDLNSDGKHTTETIGWLATTV